MALTRRKLMKRIAAAAVVNSTRLLAASSSERRIVVAGSENTTKFAVIDFTNPDMPLLSHVDPGFSAGVRVALGNTIVATGSVLTGAVRLVDLAGPTPVLRGMLSTNLSGIGAIAIRGTLVAVGELVNTYNARVNIIDFSRPDAPVLFASAQTPLISVTNIAFLTDRRVALSGPNDFRIAEVDFTSLTSPSVSTFFPQTGNPPVIDVDSVKGLIVAGDSGGRMVKSFNAVTFAQLSAIPTSQASVNSLSVSSAGFALASGTYSFTIDKVDLIGLTSSPFSPGLSGGLVTAIDDLTGACGEITGTRVALLDLNGVSRVVSVVDAGLASISTLAIGALPPPPVSNPPKLSLTPAFVTFPMTLLSSSAILKIQNTGGGTLSVRDIHISDPHFSVSTAAVDLSAGVTLNLSLKFVAVGGHGQYKATLSMSTNDPAHPTASVPLSCVAGVH